MALSGTVTKTIVAVPPAFATEDHISALRDTLVREGFVVVREEYRAVTLEDVSKFVAADQTARLVGRCYFLVVARNDAHAHLATMSSTLSDGVFVPDSGAETKAILLLFPRMSVDPIPTNIEARDFVQTHLKNVLVKGLTEVAKKKPENSVKWLAEYLLANNPRHPPVSQ